MSDAPKEYILYKYNPSLAAAAAFAALFGISALGHAAQLGLKRTWYFIPFVIGGLFEVIGYAARAVNATQSPNWTVSAYAVQSLMILLAPTLFAASIYMILGRIVRLTDGEEHSVIKSKWLTPTFVSGDVLSFLAQSAGGGLLSSAKTQKSVDLAQSLITAGLGIQILFFAVFMVVTLVFHVRMLRAPSLRSQTLTVPWQQYIIILYVASFFILVRSVFRIAEYAMGTDGVLLSHEYYLYIFDATLMLITMALFNWRHPSNIIAGKSGHKRAAESGSSEFQLSDNQVHVSGERKS